MRLKLCLFLFVIGISSAAWAVKPLIILDPGHGGKDQGAKVSHLEEKKLTLRTAYLTKKELELLGYQVVLTRARDTFLSLTSRVGVANAKASSLFVSIHYNSAKSPAAQGIEVYYYGSVAGKRRQASLELARSIMGKMVHHTHAAARGVKKGNFQVIRETTMPAVLVEAGFLTNYEERTHLSSQVYLEKLAQGIAQGIDKYVHQAHPQ